MNRKSQTPGHQLSAIGYKLILVALGCFALLQKTQAVVPPPDGGYPGFNTAEGTNALMNLTTGGGNAAIGWYSLFSNTDGSFNTGVGAGTLALNTGGSNTAVGGAALLSNTTGIDNTAVGVTALVSNGAGPYNTAIGNSALFSNTSGDNNTAVGWSALFNNTTGVVNTGIGESALYNNITGSNNTAIGDFAGFQLTGSGNICIGAGVFGLDGENNVIRIRNIGSTPVVGGTNVVVAGTGGLGDQILGYASSSRRYKEAIEPMGEGSETLFALKPVVFRAKAKTDAADVKYYGLIAEDVATVDPNLVVYNPSGKPETLRFESINAMLLNEFLKEHRKVQEQEVTIALLRSTDAKQEATITDLKKDVGVLTEQLKEQAAVIQKVSAKIEVSKIAPQVVLSDH